jgi:hypothetical protein
MDLTKKDIVFPEVPHDGCMGLKLHNLSGKRILRQYSNTPWSEIWRIHCDQWRRTADYYEQEPGDFYSAWNYLDDHPAFWSFRSIGADRQPIPLEEKLHVKNLKVEGGIKRCLQISVMKVNAETRSTEDEPTLATEVWIELGKHLWPGEGEPGDTVSGDYLLDCGGPTVETAILRAAHNVWEVYGNDRRICDGPYDKKAYAAVASSDEFEQLMQEHGDDGEINKQLQRAARRLHTIIETHEKMNPRNWQAGS